MKSRIAHIDRTLFLLSILIAVLGLVFLYSATLERTKPAEILSALVIKQCIWTISGIVLLLIIANINYLKILNLAYVVYLLNLLALFSLLVFGSERLGAKRWIDLGPISLQPSEFVKITLILALAAFMGDRRERIGTLTNYLLAILLASPAIILILLQPDLGTAIVLIAILLSILYLCGERIKYIMLSIAGGLLGLPFLWSLLRDYQKSRLLVFINPNLDPLGAGYTIMQSKIAIGSGGLFGKGWLNGTQSYLKFLPERHTDFIFSVVGEEWGFIGSLILVGIYTLIIMRGIDIIRNADDIYGRAIAGGVVTLLAFQTFVNISMTIGLMPVVGVPLPFISYGGSNIITAFIGMGFLLSISQRAH